MSDSKMLKNACHNSIWQVKVQEIRQIANIVGELKQDCKI